MSAGHPQPPSRAELSAYADGELAGRRRREVARHVAGDAESAALVAAYQRQDDLLRLGLKGIAVSSESEEDEGQEAVPPRRHGRRAFLAAAAVAALAAGSGGWWVEHGRNMAHLASDLVEEAVIAHLSYADAEASAPPSPDAAAARLRAVVGGRLAMPELSGFGLHLVALHEAAVDGRPGILLRYAGADGAGPVSCYFAQVPGRGETDLASTEVAGLTAVYRIDEGIGYAVIGRRPAGELRPIAVAGFRYAHEEGDRTEKAGG